MLNVLAANGTPVDCLGIPCQRSTSWYRLSPNLHVLSIRKFPGTGFIRQLGSGLLLVTRQGSTGRVYRLSNRDGSFAEILSGELDDDPRAWSLDGGAVVVFPTTTSLRAWWVDPQGRVLDKGSVNRRPGEPYYIVGRRILLLDEVLAEAKQRDFPPLSRKPGSWDLLLPDRDGPLDFRSGRFYLERHQEIGAIWWYDEEHGTWTRIPTEFHMAELGKLRAGLSLPTQYMFSGQLLAKVDIDHPTGILAAAIVSKGRRQLYLYDGRLGRSIPSSVSCPGEEGAISVSLTPMHGFEWLLVRFTCWGPAGPLRSRLLGLVPGSGRVQDLSWLSPIVEADLFGQWIYLNPEGPSVWVSQSGEMWQVGPGRKRLRLNPPV